MKNTKKHKIIEILTDNPNKFFTYQELAEILGFSIQTIRGACNRLTKPPNSLFKKHEDRDKNNHVISKIAYKKRDYFITRNS